MADEKIQLKQSLAKKDELHGFLVNLESLKADGSVDDQQYGEIQGEYQERLSSVTADISQLKGQLRQRLETVNRDIDDARGELDSLEIKHKVGELSTDQYESANGELRGRIDELQAEADEINRLVKAESLDDIGAPPQRPPIAREAPPTTPTPSTPKEVKPKSKKLLFIGGAVIIVIAIVLVVILLPGRNGGNTPPPVQPGTTTAEIPVSVEGASGVGSLHFELVYDSSVLEATSVKNGGILGDSLMEYNIDTPGRVVVGIVSSNGIQGNGTVAVIEFRKLADASGPVPLTLENISVYDAVTLGVVSATFKNGGYSTSDGSFTVPKMFFTGQ